MQLCGQQFKLRQLQCNDKCFLLSLRPFAFHLVPVEHDFQVIAVDAVQRVTHSPVFPSVALYHFQQRPTLAVAHIR